ncbi:hypothetical protein A8C56_08555 [Niabella ginsenosidivorans]|uniref:UDP-N-acetylglucosamine 2-epimerase domain-containing protein n=1 Tax=Niabella ginsenosidivorans TaxID=1176587 RepID=A0A1A9I2W6_9BACT|nr:UDP-N-acetylglucosamine 2-epimerase [Niabella ginsenosidivorans]ANH81022.1 hypothetical protein A8C56_08555 [Niabella ginsenosidivorans]
MKALIHVVGNRPQFIKLSVLYKAIAQYGNIRQTIIHTGQHYDFQMSDIFFKELSIPAPDIIFKNPPAGNADVFIGNTSAQLQQVFQEQDEPLVIVYGDTNTTLAGALAAIRSGCLLFHVESGIRTNNPSMPEEINRVLTDRLATTNYCCTQFNYQTMQSEGYQHAINSRLLLSGDLMYDAFLKYNTPASLQSIKTTDPYILATIHRRENILSPQYLKDIIAAFNDIHKRIQVVVPLHPHTKTIINTIDIPAGFTQIEPVGYAEMNTLLKNAAYVITDSGGLSREAYFAQKKSLIIMDKPFWPEIIASECAIATATDTIIPNFEKLAHLTPDFGSRLFGSGNAADFIANDINFFL